MAEKKAKEEAAPKKGKGKLIVIGIAALLLLGGGGGAAAYFMGLFGGGAAGDAHAAPDGGQSATAGDTHASAKASDSYGDGAAAAKAGDGGGAGAANLGFAFIDMPDLLVNLQPEGKRMHFLRLRLALEVEPGKIAETVKALTPRILDSFQLYLRSLSIAEVQGSIGMQKLKEEMLARVNIAIEPTRIRDILFKEILVQ